jgi:hypothetical protein
MSDEKDFCQTGDCPPAAPTKFNRRIFNKNVAALGFTGAMAVYFGGDPIRRLLAKDGLVPASDEYLKWAITQEWFRQGPPDEDAHPDDVKARQRAIDSGDWTYFRGRIYVPKAQPGEAAAFACGYVYEVRCSLSCCQSSYGQYRARNWRRYCCNGACNPWEALGCTIYSGCPPC